MGSSALGATVGIVGSETLFIRVDVCAAWVGRAATGGGVACAWIGGRWTGWSTGGGGVHRGGGTLPGGLFRVDIHVEPARALLDLL